MEFEGVSNPLSANSPSCIKKWPSSWARVNLLRPKVLLLAMPATAPCLVLRRIPSRFSNGLQQTSRPSSEHSCKTWTSSGFLKLAVSLAASLSGSATVFLLVDHKINEVLDFFFAILRESVKHPHVHLHAVNIGLAQQVGNGDIKESCDFV